MPTILQERDRHLLCELGLMRVMDRAEARIVGSFGSDSRTNRRLAQLTQAGFLRRFYRGRKGGGAPALYSLTKRGAWIVDIEYRSPRRTEGEVLYADFFVEHQLAVNDVYLACKYRPLPEGLTFTRWIAFREPLAPAVPLIPDGYVEFQTSEGPMGALLEVDLGNEHLKIWKKKAKQYVNLAISGHFNRLFHRERFRVLVVANSVRRMMSLRKAVAEVTSKIFFFTTRDAILQEGIFGAHWLRPTGDERQVLLP